MCTYFGDGELVIARVLTNYIEVICKYKLPIILIKSSISFPEYSIQAISVTSYGM